MSIVDTLRAWAIEQGAEPEANKAVWEALRIPVRGGVAVIWVDKKGRYKPNPHAERLLACADQKQPFPESLRPFGMKPPLDQHGRTMGEILGVYDGSNGDITKSLYAELEKLGPRGIIAMNLFRAQKCSARAKVYRGGCYRGMAYDRKSWSLGLLCTALEVHGAGLDIDYGWGLDPAAIGFEHVLYVDLPTGQVSFHNESRKAGPTYPGKWDGIKGAGTDRICRFVRDTLNAKVPEPS